MTRLLAIALVLAACSKKSADQTSAVPEKDKAPEPPKRETGAAGVGGSGPPDQGGKGGINIQTILDGDLEIAAGAIDKDVVRKVVKDNVTKLQYCYEKTLLANPGIEGKVTATFTIAAEGSVSDVKAAGVHPDVETCVADAVKAFKFPPSGNKVEVSYPITFKPA